MEARVAKEKYVRTANHVRLASAWLIAQRATETASLQGRPVAVAVLDASGAPVLTLKMDGAPDPCRDIAMRKARTALAFAIPTHRWHERLETLSPAVRLGLPLQEGLAFFGGGEPLSYRSEVVGAIGVSGASEAEDGAIAQAAAEYFADLLADG
ncbi:GlcG/HbpS family heme-binding protein [Marinobacter halodurans]|nr:heme-binding protein [Marinobacter halodurans]